MIEKCQLASSEISSEEVLSVSTVNNVINQLGSLRVSRLVITDGSGIALYDSSSESQVGKYILLPEIVMALDSNDVFSWNYHDGDMYSRAATPIISYDTLIGCVYMMEYDPDQGALIQTLQKNIFYVSVFLEVCVTIFAIFFSNSFNSLNNLSSAFCCLLSFKTSICTVLEILSKYMISKPFSFE